MKYEAEFNKWFEFIKRWEGGKSFDKTDLASKTTKVRIHTNRGVIFPTWQAVRTLLGKDKSYDSFLKMSELDHKEIAKYFWFTSGGDRWANGNMAAFFAEEFWAGGAGALMFYQKNFGVNADGIIGNKTAEAINFRCITSNNFWELLHEYKKIRYERIISKNPAQKRFEKGWDNRMQNFKETFKP